MFSYPSVVARSAEGWKIINISDEKDMRVILATNAATKGFAIEVETGMSGENGSKSAPILYAREFDMEDVNDNSSFEVTEETSFEAVESLMGKFYLPGVAAFESKNVITYTQLEADVYTFSFRWALTKPVADFKIEVPVVDRASVITNTENPNQNSVVQPPRSTGEKLRAKICDLELEHLKKTTELDQLMAEHKESLAPGGNIAKLYELAGFSRYLPELSNAVTAAAEKQVASYNEKHAAVNAQVEDLNNKLRQAVDDEKAYKQVVAEKIAKIHQQARDTERKIFDGDVEKSGLLMASERTIQRLETRLKQATKDMDEMIILKGRLEEELRKAKTDRDAFKSRAVLYKTQLDMFEARDEAHKKTNDLFATNFAKTQEILQNLDNGTISINY